MYHADNEKGEKSNDQTKTLEYLEKTNSYERKVRTRKLHGTKPGVRNVIKRIHSWVNLFVRHSGPFVREECR